MLTVLIGHGPNEINIPALVFSSFEKGLEHCKSFLGDPKKINTEKHIAYWDTDSGKLEREFEKNNPECEYDSEDDCHPTLLKLYTSVYSGCGGFYGLSLKEVEEGKPFVKWNLD